MPLFFSLYTIGLTWNDLRLAQPSLRLSHGSGGKATVFGKGSKTRMVLIPDKLWQQVKEFEKREEALRGRREASTLVFPPLSQRDTASISLPSKKYHRVNQHVFISRHHNQMERSVVHRMIKRACKRAGIDERTSAHWLRHSHEASFFRSWL
ncbi:MAG: tyrosine-type recombinase/integrase [Pleurocapsa sp. CRU_1_2]|nr:tyrosine-type recombinase/integrase [Pleurocapsa sp. CRU_1_2]